jgi:hypothetical protein
VELHAYQTHVFLDWRDLHEDASHPWGQLCDSLAGRGVPSLEDALKTLLLQPVHAALRTVMDPALAEALANARPLLARDGVEPSLETARNRAGLLLAEVERYLAGAGSPARPALACWGEGGAPESSNAAQRSLAGELFGERLEAALKLDMIHKTAGKLWPPAASGMPASDGGQRADGTKSSWIAVLGWCALEAIGTIRDPEDPDAAAAELFDALRLRGPLAAAFSAQGLADDEDWRAAARLRASFAHSSRTAAPGNAGSPTRAPFAWRGASWIHDPDVAWVIGVHEHEGVSYLVKEHLERLLWWMALRDLLEIAAAPGSPARAGFARDGVEAPGPEPERLGLIEEAISERMNAAKRGGYRVEALDETLLFNVPREREEDLQKRP